MEQAVAEAEVNDLNYSLTDEDLKYARCMAQRFFSSRHNTYAEVEDVISSAYLGLCQAASKYSPEKVDSLQTYSYLRIKGAMYDYLKENGGVARNVYKKMKSNSDDLKNKHKSYTIAKSLQELTYLRSIIEQWGISVHINKHCCIDISYVDESLPEDNVSKKDLYMEVRRALNSLPKDMKRIIYSHYFEGKSLSSLNSEFPGRSKSYVCRLHKRSLRLLKERLKDSLIMDRVLN